MFNHLSFFCLLMDYFAHVRWRTGARYAATFVFIVCVLASPAGAEEKQEAKQLPPFATVDGKVISFQEYRMAMIQAVRSRFYHGKIPQGKMASLQREVGQDVVDRVLLLKEAKRLGIEPDRDEIEKTLEGYDKRYAESKQWKKDREKILPELRKKLEDDSVLKKLEKRIKSSPAPSEKEVRAFYEANLDKFTEPEQVKVSVILLKVDPSSPQEVWDEAIKEAEGIVKRLRAGADFAELAKIHSGDSSAEKGGDMGYLHRGMLAEAAHAALDKISIGEVTDPVSLLQGIAVFRLDDRKPSWFNEFEKVKSRARDLLVRDLSEKAWSDLKARLRQNAVIEINESYYLPLSEEGKGGDKKPEGGGASGSHHGG